MPGCRRRGRTSTTTRPRSSRPSASSPTTTAPSPTSTRATERPDRAMAEFFQFVIGGLAIGSVYGLVALGFVLIFKSTDVFNFAQGDLLMVGGYLLFTMVATLHLPMIPAIVAVLAAGAVIGILLQAVVFRSMIGRPLLTVVMVTIALSLVIRSVMQVVYGTQERTLPHTIPNDSFAFLGVRISTLDLIVMGITLLCVAAFALFFKRSKLGLQMRATAESVE